MYVMIPLAPRRRSGKAVASLNSSPMTMTLADGFAASTSATRAAVCEPRESPSITWRSVSGGRRPLRDEETGDSILTGRSSNDPSEQGTLNLREDEGMFPEEADPDAGCRGVSLHFRGDYSTRESRGTPGARIGAEPVFTGLYTLRVPLLRLEADHFPTDLFRLGVAEFPWWVAHTRSRTEKVLARHLDASRIPFYLPLGERRIRRSGRTFVSHLPFFPGYVFLRGGAESRREALRSGVVVRLLEVKDQDLLDRELCQIRALQESGAPLVVHPYLGPGDAVRVREGPFRGYFGVVVREKGATRLVVSVSMLRRSVAVELERESLAPDPAARRSEGLPR